jgi:signal transduction histidine kinase
MALTPATDSKLYELRTVILAPTGRDAPLMAAFIGRLGKPCSVVQTVGELCEEIERGAGAAIVTEEALKDDAVDRLQPVLAQQPSWSDFPLLLLIAAGRVTAESERLRRLRLPLGNVLLVERPARPETLSSTLETALRGRQRQYQIRDQLQQALVTQEALRRSEKLAVTGRLAASIAHEINNPLEGITNLLYLMQMEAATEPLRSYLQMAEQELARVTEITKHTLRFYREPHQPKNIDLVGVLDSILTLYNSRLLAADVKVKREYRHPTIMIHSSPGELRQVTANLVGNAIDAMRGGGQLRLRASIETGHGGETEHGGQGQPQARLTIADTGCGIPRDVLPTIFEPFVTTKGETGTGLGLWVTREIVTKNKWSMRIRSRSEAPHRGTTFSILIPLQAEPADAAAALDAPARVERPVSEVATVSTAQAQSITAA